MTPHPAVRRNPRLAGFIALDGGARYPVVDLHAGCPASRARGTPTSVVARYDGAPRWSSPAGRGLARFGPWLPYLAFPTLGEGDTPLVELPRTAASLDLAAVWVKRESANPTGSHKDRMSPLVVARALEIAAPGVVVASSGNAAISVAAYAAAAGLRCRVVTTAAMPATYRLFLARAGAEIVEAPDSLARWPIAAAAVAEEGWLPATNHALPPVGSNPFGVEGYRSIAYELFEQTRGTLDAVFVPTARGDLIAGIAYGFADLVASGLLPASPRLFAVEPFPRVASVLARQVCVTAQFPGTTAQFSTAGTTTTDQAVRAVRGTGGGAVVIGDREAEAAQCAAARQGMDLELCAAAAVAALDAARANGSLEARARAVVVGTAASAREPTRSRDRPGAAER